MTNRMTTRIDNSPLRMKIVWQVLEAAKDNNDVTVINACRRLINARTPLAGANITTRPIWRS